jgi:hypothetical protein
MDTSKKLGDVLLVTAFLPLLSFLTEQATGSHAWHMMDAE